MKRGQTNISCLLAVDKPQGMGSHDVVNRVRRISGERRVGHCGTLDPMATGLLLVAVGPATRLSEYLIGHDKRYIARVSWGVATDTDDAEGTVVSRMPLPAAVDDPVFAQSLLDALLGDSMQVPPLYSAIKREGVKAYEAARKGSGVELEPRPITVYRADLITIGWLEGVPYWDVDFEVSKGTYIRALARDLGVAAGSVAHLSALRRCVAGPMSVDDAHSLQQLEEAADIRELSCDPVAALGLPCVEVDPEQLQAIQQGRRLRAPEGTPQGLVALICGAILCSVHECQGDVLVPRTVIPGGVIRGGGA
ncbi:MAG: tRNA pseudouridine(55) synthase TruB [Coriobacteriales bacterium]|nr:tRNA pseudouridine(55) synthase TruB [Coriobacteriales bacterium]